MADRIIIGQRGPGEWGFWVSKPGRSVWSTDENDFLVTPAMALTLPHLVGYATAPATIYHGLGYVPVVYIGPGPPDGFIGPDYWAVTSSELVVRASSSHIVPYVVWPILAA